MYIISKFLILCFNSRFSHTKLSFKMIISDRCQYINEVFDGVKKYKGTFPGINTNLCFGDFELNFMLSFKRFLPKNPYLHQNI